MNGKQPYTKPTLQRFDTAEAPDKGSLHEGDLEVQAYLESSTHIDPLFIKEEFVKLPASVAYWGGRYATAQRDHLRAKQALVEVEAAEWSLQKETLMDMRGKATVDDIKAAVSLQDDIKVARAAVIEAEYERERLRGIIDAVRTKRDMLISIGAHVRAEMQGDPIVRENQRQRSDAWGQELQEGSDAVADD